ncbi:hypothetical protein K505DRAFT_300328 [Melanomma pulvis-pyrius CBS 109.77]|uniref:ATPase synthesis protein 25 n=1 Tax=Melanomma pulvis-pyrius CBS 109.77 TaxID=1314802 RepID=A0A6A6XIN6_9PLEO|nr:hypothetical protein K505DRAFT_300328 [Melanomma pulvis-pyrius CBS 109.77]
MSLSRAVSSSLSCHGCRNAIVRSFVSSALSNPIVLSCGNRTASIPPRPTRRSFTSTPTRRQEKDGLGLLEEEADLEASRSSIGAKHRTLDSEDPATPKVQYPIAINHATADSRVDPSSIAGSDATAVQNIPWYLRDRVEPVATQAAQIPDLPPNPPPLLETLLHYISMTAGLDDLLVLDLRHLDPPPALGPKLIMIMGTARSEKHLHVSADRFCRWLRREHHLRANAAGLLGRNELKIKLRRKAKRMKMLANVGGQEPEGNLDDGIRTGWICCTVGKIEAHPEDMHMPGDDVENFVGFREVKPGVNVVVQMFVEEKRAEIDLETLWGGVMKTHDREGKMADKILEELDKENTLEEGANGKVAGEQLPPPTGKAQTPRALPPSRSPTSAGDPFPGSSTPSAQWIRPKASAGDPFPPASDPYLARPRHIRRLHTVGLRQS